MNVLMVDMTAIRKWWRIWWEFPNATLSTLNLGFLLFLVVWASVEMPFSDSYEGPSGLAGGFFWAVVGGMWCVYLIDLVIHWRSSNYPPRYRFYMIVTLLLFPLLWLLSKYGLIEQRF